MSISSKNHMLGKFDLIEVYEYFDEPILFSCRSLTDQIYFAVWANRENQIDDWVYVAVSSPRFTSIRNGQVELRHVFSQPENGTFWHLKHDRRDKTWVSDVRNIETLPVKWLPDEGEYLEVELPEAEEVKQLAAKAVSARRSVMNFHLNPPGSEESEAPAKLAGEFLIGLQDMTYAIGDIVSGTAKTRGRYNAATKSGVELYVRPFDGSFGLEISTKSMRGSKASEIADSTFDTLFSLISSGEKIDQLNNKLTLVQERVANKYKGLMELIANSGLQLGVAWSSSDGIRNGTTLINSTTARDIVNRMKKKEDESTLKLLFPGRFSAINLNSGYFSVQDSRDGSKYKGYMLEEVMPFVREVRLDAEYGITLIRKMLIDEASGKESFRYSLSKLDSLSRT